VLPNSDDDEAMTSLDRRKIHADFHRAVNMTASEIEEWLLTEESQSVGWKGSDGSRDESVGHASGRRIAKILRKRNSELTEDDYQHMRKVVGYVHRHSARRPSNIYTSRWRYSLMNWGNDPVKAV
jgi:hypothetical protein